MEDAKPPLPDGPPPGESPSKRIPAAVVRLWLDAREPGTGAGDLDPQAESLEPGLFALLPEPGDPDVVEAAIYWAQRAIAASDDPGNTRCLVFPGIVRQRGEELELLEDQFTRDLNREPPRVRPGEVHLTGHAVRELESRWLTEGCGEYTGPSGRSRTLWKLRQASRDLPPWRNVELLRQRTPLLEAPVHEELRDARNEPAVLVTGPLGTGKTRAVAETGAADIPVLWARCWSRRSGGPPLAREIARGLLLGNLGNDALLRHRPTLASWWRQEEDGADRELAEDVSRALETASDDATLTLVLDDLHCASSFDRELVGMLLAHSKLGRGFRLVLLSRGQDWTEAWQIPRVELAALPPSLAEVFWHRLVDGLSMPRSVRDHYLEISGGHPQALEDGLLQLVRRRLLRQMYGNFFYSGPAEVGYEPTPRLTRHLLSELRRQRASFAGDCLALADRPMAPEVIETAALSLSDGEEEGGLHRLLGSGILEQYVSSWGPVVRFRYPALARSLSLLFEDPTSIREHLSAPDHRQPREAREAWQAYLASAGGLDGPQALLSAARHADSLDQRALFEAFREELAQSDRALGADTELDLLWTFLPLARRLGQLRNLEPAIDRALELAADDPDRTLALMSLKSDHALNAGELDKAARLLERTLRLAKGSRPKRQTILLFQLGKLLRRQERLDEAERLFEGLLGRLDDEHSPTAATCLYSLGNIEARRSLFTKAQELHLRALRIRQRQALPLQEGQSLTALGRIELALGDYPRAIELLQTAQKLLRRHGGPAEESYALLGLGQTYSRLGEFDQASEQIGRVLDLRAGTDDQLGEAVARLALAENELLAGRIEQAQRSARMAHFKLTVLGVPHAAARAEQLIGRIHLLRRELQRAFEAFRVATEKQRLNPSLQVHALAGLIEAAVALGDTAEVLAQSQELAAELDKVYPEQGEWLDLRLYWAWRWLRRHGLDSPDPVEPLRRAATELQRKAGRLDPRRRQRFLEEISDNRAIRRAAQEHGL